MNAMVAPDGKPAQFNGQTWVSEDGKFWWNGAAWQPVSRKRRPNFFVIGMGAVILIAVGLALTGVIKPGQPPQAPKVVLGVSNMKIDSPTQIEFDYARSTRCDQVTFNISFYDKAGRVLDKYIGAANFVSAGVMRHYVFTTDHAIPASAVRFTVNATCS